MVSNTEEMDRSEKERKRREWVEREGKERKGEECMNVYILTDHFEDKIKAKLYLSHSKTLN